MLARSATLCGEAAELLEEVAAEDLQVATGSREDTLQAAAVAGLARSRARNLLRHWLQVAGVSTPSRVVLERVLDEVVGCRPDAEPCVSWQGGEVRVLAGGTDLVAWMRDEALSPDLLVDIKEIEGLGAIVDEGEVISIGSLVTFSDLIKSDLINARLPLISEMSGTVGSNVTLSSSEPYW